jgi:hypothetical protein
MNAFCVFIPLDPIKIKDFSGNFVDLKERLVYPFC